MVSIIFTILGGLGIFFVGVNVLGDSIKKLGGTHAPKVIRSLASNDLKSTLGGMIAGIITNSGKTVTFSLVALSELGVLNLRKCLPIIMGGSVGSAFIVLYASFSFENVVYGLFLIAGIFYQFGNMKKDRTKLIAGVALGFALLLYGLHLIKVGAAPMKEFPWFEGYIKATQGHWLLALAVGAVLALVSQSGSSVAIIAISLVNTHILGYDEAVMLIFGTNIGSGISTAMLGFGLNDLSRQLILFHGFFKIIGVVVMVPALYLEVYAGVPLLKDFVAGMTGDASMQIALIYLLYEIVTAMLVASFLPQIARMIESVTLHTVFARAKEPVAAVAEAPVVVETAAVEAAAPLASSLAMDLPATAREAFLFPDLAVPQPQIKLERPVRSPAVPQAAMRSSVSREAPSSAPRPATRHEAAPRVQPTPPVQVAPAPATTPAGARAGMLPPAMPVLFPPRVAVLFPAGFENGELRRALLRRGIDVVAYLPLDVNWHDVIDEDSIDLLLVNLDTNNELDAGSLEYLLEHTHLPVVFNENIFPHLHQTSRPHDPSWIDTLVRKMYILTGRTPQEEFINA